MTDARARLFHNRFAYTFHKMKFITYTQWARALCDYGDMDE